MNEEKHIEEMRKEVAKAHRFFLEDDDYESLDDYIADELYNAGYRKQSEGEWIVTQNNGFWHYDCPFCDDGYAQETKLPTSNYCANCGARLTEPKMEKGGAE